MVKRNIKVIILAVSLIINLVTLSGITALRFSDDNDIKEKKQIEPEVSYEFGSYVLEYKEPVELGNFIIIYTRRNSVATFIDKSTQQYSHSIFHLTTNQII
jgi:hypothetical protein